MKLITINTWQGRLQRNLDAFIKDEQADLICMQELCSAEELTNNAAAWTQFATLQTLQRSSSLEYNYFSPTNSYDLMGEEVGFGNGILSRQPMSDVKTIFTCGEYHKVTAANFVSNVRNAQIVQILVGKDLVWVVNYHAHWEPNPKGTEASLARMKKFATALQNLSGPLIVVGDFNVTATSDSLRYLKEALSIRSLTEESGIQSTMSNALTPWEVACDHILVNDQIEVKSFSVDNRLVSDHKALIMEFETNVKT
ncbi:MAG: endonuclease/exonuclease/phosphatase family protein [Candidatus Saccharimonadales bacterium]